MFKNWQISTVASRIFPGVVLWRQYERKWFRFDVVAGLSIATNAMPVGIAYAGLANVPPIVGLYSAIVPLFAYALFGSSRQLIIGPDAATCLLVASSLGLLSHGDPQFYLMLLPLLTVTTGIVYLVAGTARLGFIANFFSKPILTGYLNGIALIIVVGQISKLLGYPSHAHDVLSQFRDLAAGWGQRNLATLCLSLAEITLLLALRFLAPMLPAPLFAVLGGIAAVKLFDLQADGVAVIGPLFSNLPAWSPPALASIPYLSLLHDAAAITLISFASGMLTAKSFAARNHYVVDANQELLAFGIGNIVAGLFHGFPVTGADSRTAVNNAVGGKSQLSSIVAAVAMILVLVFAGSWLSDIPTAALASVVFVSALALFDLQTLLELMRMNWREGLLSVITTGGVLILGVLPGVVLAIALCLAWLLIDASRPIVTELGRVNGIKGFHSLADYPSAKTTPGLLVFRFEGNMLFFNIDYFGDCLRSAIKRAASPVSWVILDSSPINLIDVTSALYLRSLLHELKEGGITLCFAQAKHSLDRVFNRRWVLRWQESSGVLLFPTLKTAIHAYEQAVAKVTPPTGETGERPENGPVDAIAEPPQ